MCLGINRLVHYGIMRQVYISGIGHYHSFINLERIDSEQRWTDISPANVSVHRPEIKDQF